MSLYSLDTVRRLLQIPASNTSQDDVLEAIGQGVDRATKEYLGQEVEQATYTEFYSGTGTRQLVLNQRPVWAPVYTGNTVSGSTTISGMSSTAGLFVNGPVIGTGVPNSSTSVQATITALTSTTITMSTAATATATGVALSFPPAVWEDFDGNFGQTLGSFASSTQLIPGTDYAARLDWTMPGANMVVSRSGMLFRILSTWSQIARRSQLGWVSLDPGPLTADYGPVHGALKVQYTAGWPASAIPADLVLGLSQLVVVIKRQMPFGMMLNSENLGSYSYSLAQAQVGRIPEIGSVRQLFGRMREIAV